MELEAILSYPEIFLFEARDLAMGGADLVEEVEEEVHVVHGLDALVDGVHDNGGVLGQLQRLSLLVPRSQLPELGEQRDQLRVVLEQPGIQCVVLNVYTKFFCI